MLRKLPLAMSIALALMPLQSQALGLGEITTNSVLNQPFDAEIRLLSVPPGELDGVKVSLADLDAFKRADVDRPFLLSKLKFETERKANGEAVVKVFSRSLIQEPFLNFLVEVNWPKGRMVREFTVLLDPPLTTGRKARAVSAPSASTVSSSTGSGRAMQPQRVPVTAADGEYGPVKINETLWQIADRYRPNGISVQQMMQAVLAANSQAFYANNINNLKAGSILRIPEKDEISISHAQAVSLSAEQYRDWKQGVSKPVKPAAEVAEKTETPEASAPAPVDAEQQASDEAARLKLSGSDVADQMGSGEDSDIESVKQELLAVQEKAVSSETEAQELREMTANLEKQLADMKRLLELKDEQLSKLQQAATEGGVSLEELEETIEVTTEEEAAETEEAVEAEEEMLPSETTEVMEPEAETEAVTEAEAVTEEAEMQPESEPVTEEPVAQAPAAEETEQKQPAKQESLLDMITGSATMMGIAIAVLVVLLALIWSAFSRRKGREEEEETVVPPVAKVEKIEPSVAAAAPVPDEHPDEESVLSEFTPADLQSLEDQETGEVDPIAEADVYIAYGRFDQAEDLVKQALESEPGKLAYQHKLLEIYYANKDQAKYTELANQMHEDGAEEADPDAWNRAKLMGADVDPENPLFADAMDVPSVDLGDDLDMALSELESQLTDDASSLTDLDQVSEQLEEVNLEEVAGKTAAVDEDEIIPLPDVELDTSQTTTETEDEKIDQLAAELESFDIDALDEESTAPSSEDLASLDESLLPEEESLEDLAAELDEIDDVTTKLDLARAYIEMGDKEGARGILEEVLEEGSDAQKQQAQTILSEIS